MVTSSFFSGITSGVITVIICNPIDVFKTRIQSSNKYGIYTIIKKEKISGFYKGASSAFFAMPIFWGLYFPIYENNKKYMNNSLAGYSASLVGSLISNPFWVARTRLQAQILHKNRNYKGTLDVLKQVYQKEGFRALFRGYTMTILGNLQFVISMPIYEEIKKKNNNSTISIIFGSAIAKSISGSIVYPHEVIRTIMRNQNYSFNKTINCLYSNSGLLGFYRGFPLYLMRTIPFSISIFLSYELNKSLIFK
jgi:hypothetical protein